MSEQEPQIQIPLEQIMASMAKIETPGVRGGLGEALQEIGYEMRSAVMDEKIIIWIHASRSLTIAKNAPTVALMLSKNGLLHAPKHDRTKDEFYDETSEKEQPRLLKLSVNQYENEVQFDFKDGEGNSRIIKLATHFVLEKGAKT